MNAVIETRDLCKDFTTRIKTGRFRSTRRIISAVKGVSLSVEAGETVGYIGSNGSGKSTTMKMFSGVLTPTAGHVRVCGLEPVSERLRLTRRLGVVFGQRSALWWDLPLKESFRLLRHVFNVPRADHAARLKRCRQVLDLDEFMDTPVRQLSLGQRMRGEITAALLHGPQVLFLDEPTIGLDVVSKQAVRRFLADLKSAGDTTVLLTTHDLADIERLCPRLIVIDRGRIVHDGGLRDLRDRYGDGPEVVAEFDVEFDVALGLDGVTAERVDGDPRRMRFRLDRHRSPGEVVAYLASRAPLRDVSITEPNIDTVVAALYRDGREPS